MPKTYETSERASKDFLKTRYFKANSSRVMDFIKGLLEKDGLNVVAYNTEYGEISATSDYYDVTIKVFQFSISEVSVDMFIDSRYIFDFGKTKKIINDFFEKLSKEFPFIGLSLHK